MKNLDSHTPDRIGDMVDKYGTIVLKGAAVILCMLVAAAAYSHGM